MIPGSDDLLEKGIAYPLQYSWASLVAQLVKNPPAMQETWIRPLGWDDPLEKGKTTHSSILAWRILGRKEWDTTERLSLSLVRSSQLGGRDVKTVIIQRKKECSEGPCWSSS